MSEKFTDEQIIDALTRCCEDNAGQCEKCAYTAKCKRGEYTLMFKDVLDLINRQKAAIEEKSKRLKEVLPIKY